MLGAATMHRERNHEIAIGPSAEGDAAAAAAALRGGAVKGGRALTEGHPIVLKFGRGALGHHANNGQAALCQLGSLRSNLSAEIDGEATADGGTDGGQVGCGPEMVAVSPSGEVTRSVGQLPQQVATDHASVMPEVTGHIVAETGAGLEITDGGDKSQRAHATLASGHRVPMHPSVVTGFRIAAAITGQGASGGAACAAGGADRDRAGLGVARLERQRSVHRFLNAIASSL